VLVAFWIASDKITLQARAGALWEPFQRHSVDGTTGQIDKLPQRTRRRLNGTRHGNHALRVPADATACRRAQQIKFGGLRKTLPSGSYN